MSPSPAELRPSALSACPRSLRNRLEQLQADARQLEKRLADVAAAIAHADHAADAAIALRQGLENPLAEARDRNRQVRWRTQWLMWPRVAGLSAYLAFGTPVFVLGHESATLQDGLWAFLAFVLLFVLGAGSIAHGSFPALVQRHD